MTTIRKLQDGGPAFACAAENGHQEGMSLRDYFAAHAPGDLCKNPHEYLDEGEALIGRTYPASVIEQGVWAMEVEAKLRYIYADAMLKAREDSQ